MLDMDSSVIDKNALGNPHFLFGYTVCYIMACLDIIGSSSQTCNLNQSLMKLNEMESLGEQVGKRKY